MVLFAIPDIRLFWSGDKRFTKQFKAGEISTFKPYSKVRRARGASAFGGCCCHDAAAAASRVLQQPPRARPSDALAMPSTRVLRLRRQYPPCFKDISFWLPEGFEPNDFFEIGREVCGELVENMSLVDEFTNPKKGKTSHCYRITYRSMDRSLTDDEVNAMQESLREKAESKLGVELR